MASIAESLDQSSLNASLVAGVDTISANGSVTFAEYARQVLPLDGYIFWLRTGGTFTAKGSLHAASAVDQQEDGTIVVNRVVFTSEQEVQDFNAVAPDKMYIALVGEIQFAFHGQKNFYNQAGIFHYFGDSVNAPVTTQIIDDVSLLDPDAVIVSNSLPIWLALGASSVFGLTAPTFPIYPSFLVPQNAVPPYAAVHIGDTDTEAIQSAPSFDVESTHSQLCKDKVRITFYGLRNDEALDFQDYLFQYSLNTDNIGIMSMPVIRDAKRTQREIGVIAQKKSFDVDVSYYQSRVQELARQFLLRSIQTYLPTSL